MNITKNVSTGNSDPLTSFSQRIGILRRELGLTQEKLAKEVGIAFNTLKGYTRSSPTAPCFDNLIDLASFFNVSLDYLCGRSDIREVASISSPEEYLMNLYYIAQNNTYQVDSAKQKVTIEIQDEGVTLFFKNLPSNLALEDARRLAESFHHYKIFKAHLLREDQYEKLMYDLKKFEFIYGDIREEDFSMFPDETYPLVATLEEEWEAHEDEIKAGTWPPAKK